MYLSLYSANGPLLSPIYFFHEPTWVKLRKVYSRPTYRQRSSWHYLAVYELKWLLESSRKGNKLISRTGILEINCCFNFSWGIPQDSSWNFSHQYRKVDDGKEYKLDLGFAKMELKANKMNPISEGIQRMEILSWQFWFFNWFDYFNFLYIIGKKIPTMS